MTEEVPAYEFVPMPEFPTEAEDYDGEDESQAPALPRREAEQHHFPPKFPRASFGRGRASRAEARNSVLPEPISLPELWWEHVCRTWGHVCQLYRNGILIQALGVPARHFLGLYGLLLCLRGVVGWRTLLFAFTLWPVSGLGVTAGAHRLWTHRSYEATAFMQGLLMMMFSVADQGTIEGWALTHAMHHNASDTCWDPHNRQAGFWHAHFGWLYATQRFHLPASDYLRVKSGLGPVVRFHDTVCLAWDPFWSLGMPTLVASFWGEALNGLFVAGALRWMFVQHVTFFVNSVAHGERAGEENLFDRSACGIGPRVSFTTTILALGEGWHDYHHLFPWDYAAAELGAWDQWNPTKIFIDACSAAGIATSRRRCSSRLQLARRDQLQGNPEPSAYTVAGPLFLRHRVCVPAAARGGQAPPVAGHLGGSSKAD